MTMIHAGIFIVEFEQADYNWAICLQSYSKLVFLLQNIFDRGIFWWMS